MLPEILKIENKIPNQYEPIRNCRFEFKLPKEFGIENWLIQSVSLPKFSKDENGNFIEYKMLVTFINLIGPSAAQKIFHNFIVENKNNFDCELSLLDPTGIEVSLWEIKINDVISIDFGQLDYDNDSINIIEMILNVEKAILKY